jgi:pimeloyl-ACP methyl ester carboxylesterase
VASPRRQAAEPWTNPGRLGQYQAELAWLEDGSQLDRLSRITSPLPGHGVRARLLVPAAGLREAARRIPGCRHTELPGLGHGAPLLAAGQVNPALA